MSNSPSTVDWVSRVGAPAASARRSSRRGRILGIILLACVPVAVLAVVALFAAERGNPSVASVATVASIGVVLGILGFAALSSSLDAHGRAIDGTVAHLRRSYPDLTASEAHDLLGSTRAFDAGVTGRVASVAAPPPTVTWTTDLVRPILPGPTEATLVTAHRRIGVVAVLGLSALALLAVLHRVPSHRLWYAGWAVVGVIFLVSFAFWLAAIVRGRQEFREGYTTAPTGTQLVARNQLRPVDAHTSLDFVDGKTGYLLRHSNAVLLTPARYAERLRQVRAAHPDAAPTRITSV